MMCLHIIESPSFGTHPDWRGVSCPLRKSERIGLTDWRRAADHSPAGLLLPLGGV
jgi:hypothetical protein